MKRTEKDMAIQRLREQILLAMDVSRLHTLTDDVILDVTKDAVSFWDLRQRGGVRRNCRTCKLCEPPSIVTSRFVTCGAVTWDNDARDEALEEWCASIDWGKDGYPPEDADNCPEWKKRSDGK